MIFAIPSKGRLKDQVEAWLAECGFKLEMAGGSRGYSAELSGLPGVSVRLLSAGDIAAGLDAGELHLGVTGEDLLRERGDDMDSRVMLLRALGFGRADLVVTAPKSWLDVDTMADIDEVGHAHLAKTGRRLRVATKYVTQTRAFFARHGVADYRIVESSGATEGAPAAGAAELVVDITTTGATLAANGLKILSDGVILKSQAQLTASLIADWSADQLDSLRRCCRWSRPRVGRPSWRPWSGRPSMTTRPRPPSPPSSPRAARAGPTAPCWRRRPVRRRRRPGPSRGRAGDGVAPGLCL
jgi:ATP phosphoribosyltransferase